MTRGGVASCMSAEQRWCDVLLRRVRELEGAWRDETVWGKGEKKMKLMSDGRLDREANLCLLEIAYPPFFEQRVALLVQRVHAVHMLKQRRVHPCTRRCTTWSLIS